MIHAVLRTPNLSLLTYNFFLFFFASKRYGESRVVSRLTQKHCYIAHRGQVSRKQSTETARRSQTRANIPISRRSLRPASSSTKKLGVGGADLVPVHAARTSSAKLSKESTHGRRCRCTCLRWVGFLLALLDQATIGLPDGWCRVESSCGGALVSSGR